MTMPHDVTDLYLSPVALAVDERLQELDGLSPSELTFRLALETNSEPRSRSAAVAALLAYAAYLVDTHGWEFEWDQRGLRLTHEGHTLVLGLPDNVRTYVDSFEAVPVS